MGRATFEGPILSGDNRFGPLRNVGYTDLVQNVDLDFTNTTPFTANYGGNSGQFVSSAGILNANGTVYTPSSTVYPPVAATITADTVSTTTGTLYRGAVFYLPYGCNINDFIVDTGLAMTLSAGTPAIAVKIGNAFNTATYASISDATSLGRNTVTYSTAGQVIALQSTTGDITNPPAATGGGGGTGPYSSLLSQVVVTFVITYTGGTSGTLSTISAGKFFAAVRYQQLDQNIGNSTTYPYGNFD